MSKKEGAMIILSFLAAVLLHECGHLFALTLFHARIEKARFSPFGITLTHSRLPSPIASFTVAAFGPFLGMIGYAAAQFSGELPLFQTITLSLSLFNLLPIATLDGGRMMNATLSFFLPTPKAETVSRVVSEFTLLVLWLLGAYLFLWTNGSPSFFLMALTLFFESIKHEG